jgi:hypothetical protein
VLVSVVERVLFDVDLVHGVDKRVLQGAKDLQFPPYLEHLLLVQVSSADLPPRVDLLV